MDAVFITNTRGLEATSNQDDRQLVYSSFPDWDRPEFKPPDVYNWQDIVLTFAGFKMSCRVFVIGSTAADIVNGKTAVARAKAQIETAVQAAEKLGARVVCFGASTKRLAENSLRSGKFPEGVVYTNGDTLTCGVALEEIETYSSKCGLDLADPDTRVAIVGAYGIIGTALTERLIARHKCRLSLIGPNPAKLDLLNKRFGSRVETLTNVSELNARVHLVVTATNHPNALLTDKIIEGWGRPLMVCDIAQPRNISKQVCETSGENLITWEACIVANPLMRYEHHLGMGLDVNGLKGLAKAILHIPSHRTFACLAETFVLALAELVDPEIIKNREFMGDIASENIDPILKLAKKYGFQSRRPESYGKKVDLYKIF